MIKVSFYYPNDEGKRFDLDYYCSRHIPLVREKFGAALKRVDVEKGMQAGHAGSKAPFLVAGHLYFDSLESFQSAFLGNVKVLMVDILNFTDIQSLVQISEVIF